MVAVVCSQTPNLTDTGKSDRFQPKTNNSHTKYEILWRRTLSLAWNCDTCWRWMGRKIGGKLRHAILYSTYTLLVFTLHYIIKWDRNENQNVEMAIVCLYWLWWFLSLGLFVKVSSGWVVLCLFFSSGWRKDKVPLNYIHSRALSRSLKTNLKAICSGQETTQ